MSLDICGTWLSHTAHFSILHCYITLLIYELTLQTVTDAALLKRQTREIEDLRMKLQVDGVPFSDDSYLILCSWRRKIDFLTNNTIIPGLMFWKISIQVGALFLQIFFPVNVILVTRLQFTSLLAKPVT